MKTNTLFILCFLWCCAMIVFGGDKILRKVAYVCVQCQNVCSKKKDLKKPGSKYHLFGLCGMTSMFKKPFKEAHEETTLSKANDQRGCLGPSNLAQTDPRIACLALP